MGGEIFMSEIWFNVMEMFFEFFFLEILFYEYLSGLITWHNHNHLL
jgi:hypothetical protein